MLDYTFTVLGAQAIFSGHDPNNTPSAGLIRSLDLTHLGDEFYPPTGLYHPSYELKQPSSDGERGA